MADKAKLEAALKNFEEATRNHEFKGARHPADHDFDEAWFKAAKLRLRMLIGVAASNRTNIDRLENLLKIVREGIATPEQREAFEKKELALLAERRKK